MEIVIIIGIIIGIIVGFFLGKLMAAKTASEEKTQLVAKAQVLAAEMEQVKSLTDQVRQQAEKDKEVLCKQAEKEKENLKEHYDVILKNERAHHAGIEGSTCFGDAVAEGTDGERTPVCCQTAC